MSTAGFATTSKLTPADWYAYQSAVVLRAHSRGARGMALLVGVPVIVGALAFALLEFGPARDQGRTLVLGVLVGYLALLAVSRISRRMIRPGANGAFLGDWHVEFTAAGIAVRRPFVESSIKWNAVRDVTATADHIFVWIDSVAAFVVPVRDLPGSLSSQSAQDIIRHLSATPSEPTDGGSSVPAPVPVAFSERARRPASTRRSLGALSRWFTFRAVDGAALAAPDGPIATVAALAVLLMIGLERIGVGPVAEFSWWAAGRLAWEALLLLAVAWLVLRTTNPRGEWRRRSCSSWSRWRPFS